MNRYSKKIITAIVAAGMVLCGAVSAVAETADTMYIGAFVDGKSNCFIDKSKIGDTVNVDFDVIGNPGIASATFYVRYDPSVLRAKSGCSPASNKLQSGGYIYYTVYNEDIGMDVNYPLIKNKTVNEQIAYVPAADTAAYSDVGADGVKTSAELGKIKLAAAVPVEYRDSDDHLNAVEGDGHLFSMTFDVVGEGDASLYIETVRFGYKPFTNGQSNIYRPVPTAVYPGKILVGSDVNGDGVLDVADAKLVLKYTANAAALTNEQFTRADFNNDGKVDILDVIAIEKYIE